MGHVTINMQSLVNKMVINNTGVEGDIKVRVTEALLTAVNDSQALMEEGSKRRDSKWWNLMEWANGNQDWYLFNRAAKMYYGN